MALCTTTIRVVIIILGVLEQDGNF